MESEIPIGIDIGTWPCCVAVWNGSSFDLFSNPTKENIKKSCEPFKDDSSSVGDICTNKVSISRDEMLDMLYEATIYKMRRLIGRTDTDPVVHVSKNFPYMVQLQTMDIGVRPLISLKKKETLVYTTIERVLEEYVGQLRVLAETKLKRPVRNVVFTVPVSFSRLQLNRIHCTCAMAGLNVLKLMPQPTAVALLYAQQQLQASSSSHADKDSERKKNALIFNMDSGYCDVAVTTVKEGECQMKALAGNAIGGEDLVGNLMSHLLSDSENEFMKHLDGDKKFNAMVRLRGAILEVIHRLSSQTSVGFNSHLGYGCKIHKVVTREEFEDINKEVFEKCERLIIQCLQDAKVEGVDEINDVIIVGGFFHIPRVINLVTDICKVKELYKDMNPLTASVCGAAVAGAVASGIDDPSGNLNLVTSHVTPLAVGIRANGRNFVPVIPRNASVPTTRVIYFTTIHDNQTEALILIYEGEGQKADENHLLGYLKIMGIPAAPKGVPEIKMGMNINGKNELTVASAVYMPGSQEPVVPAMRARMPMSVIDDGLFCMLRH